MASATGSALSQAKIDLIAATRRGARATTAEAVNEAADAIALLAGRVAAIEKLTLAAGRLHAAG